MFSVYSKKKRIGLAVNTFGGDGTHIRTHTECVAADLDVYARDVKDCGRNVAAFAL